MTSILVPTDGSPTSARDLPIAATLADRTGADLHLLRVVEPQYWGSIGTHELKLQAAAVESLRQVAQRLEQARGREPRTTVEIGPAGKAILSTARASHPLLIVMSTHSREGVARTILGSVAEEVLERGSSPLVLVPSHAEALRHWQPRRILVALDGSRLSKLILPAVYRLAAMLRAEVEVEQVYGGPDGSSIDPAERILELASHHNDDLLSLATRGRSGLTAARPGPAVGHLLRRSTVPVLAFGAHLLASLDEQDTGEDATRSRAVAGASGR